jgi:hypothetical protein
MNPSPWAFDWRPPIPPAVARRLIDLATQVAEVLLVGVAGEGRTRLAAEVCLPGTALALLARPITVSHLAEFGAACTHAPRRRGAGADVAGKFGALRPRYARSGAAFIAADRLAFGVLGLIALATIFAPMALLAANRLLLFALIEFNVVAGVSHGSSSIAPASLLIDNRIGPSPFRGNAAGARKRPPIV